LPYVASGTSMGEIRISEVSKTLQIELDMQNADPLVAHERRDALEEHRSQRGFILPATRAMARYFSIWTPCSPATR
ncbi:MAG: hypothetical protein WCS65_17905, partial [Verrucomicrobiae bacterium]